MLQPALRPKIGAVLYTRELKVEHLVGIRCLACTVGHGKPHGKTEHVSSCFNKNIQNPSNIIKYLQILTFLPTWIEFQGWLTVNVSFSVLTRLLQRRLLAEHRIDISKSGCSLISNALGILPLVLTAYFNGELDAEKLGDGLWETSSCVWIKVGDFVVQFHRFIIDSSKFYETFFWWKMSPHVSKRVQ